MFSNVLETAVKWHAERSDETVPSGLDAIRLGVKGGVVGTVVMTAFRIPIAHSLPPTANFWAKYIGSDSAEEYTVQGIILHLLYGVGSGVAFVLSCAPGASGSEATKEGQGILRGAAFSVVLSVFGLRVVLKRMLDMELETDERFIFHVSHIIFGLTLGAWVGSNV